MIRSTSSSLTPLFRALVPIRCQRSSTTCERSAFRT
jgi:hypothetical protein